MQNVNYVLLVPEGILPDVSMYGPFRAVIVVEEEVSKDWRDQVSEWLVEAGCLYFMAWGIDCSYWHDSVDYANLAKYSLLEIPDDNFIMTTDHNNESLDDVFEFSRLTANHPDIELHNTLILHVANTERKDELLGRYR